MPIEAPTVKTRKSTYIESHAITDLTPYNLNPRDNAAAVAAVAESIATFGFTNPLIINDKGIVCCGHTRLKAAIERRGSRERTDSSV